MYIYTLKLLYEDVSHEKRVLNNTDIKIQQNQLALEEIKRINVIVYSIFCTINKKLKMTNNSVDKAISTPLSKNTQKKRSKKIIIL